VILPLKVIINFASLGFSDNNLTKSFKKYQVDLLSFSLEFAYINPLILRAKSAYSKNSLSFR